MKQLIAGLIFGLGIIAVFLFIIGQDVLAIFLHPAVIIGIILSVVIIVMLDNWREGL